LALAAAAAATAATATATAAAATATAAAATAATATTEDVVVCAAVWAAGETRTERLAVAEGEGVWGVVAAVVVRRTGLFDDTEILGTRRRRRCAAQGGEQRRTLRAHILVPAQQTRGAPADAQSTTALGLEPSFGAQGEGGALGLTHGR
jgi:hypothetical protein